MTHPKYNEVVQQFALITVQSGPLLSFFFSQGKFVTFVPHVTRLMQIISRKSQNVAVHFF